MNAASREWLLLRRSRASLVAMVLLGLLSAAAVALGLREVQRQQQLQVALLQQQNAETAVLAEWIDRTGDAGYAAYYTFHPTWNPPAPLAFAALGLRDVAPQTLRVRALGLEAQLYENESLNPELALAGRFDYAFVVVYLLPLIVIALLHDLVSRERDSGRLYLLSSLAPRISSVWGSRVLLRTLCAAALLLLPLWLGAALAQTPLSAVLGFSGVVLAYLLFWVLLTVLVGLVRWPAALHAAVMMSLWALLTLALPTAAQSWIAQRVPVGQGVELTLAHRERVHAAWDLPKDATMEPFVATHPEWRGTPPVTGRFHWKWYYAFHQVADQAVAPRARAYRQALMTRQRLTERAGWVLPTVGAQVWLHRLAGTDLPAQLAYEDEIRAFHERLRRFYYPYLFEERRFGREDFALAPRFQ